MSPGFGNVQAEFWEPGVGVCSENELRVGEKRETAFMVLLSCNYSTSVGLPLAVIQTNESLLHRPLLPLYYQLFSLLQEKVHCHKDYSVCNFVMMD